MSENLKKRQQTKQSLQKAFIELSNENGYHAISVGDICQRANMYRSTFYRYYDSKDSLRHDIETAYVEETRQITGGLSSGGFLQDPTNAEKSRKELIRDMEFHRDHRDLSRFLLSSSGEHGLVEEMKASVAKTYLRSIESGHVSLGDFQDYTVHFFASGFVSSISSWVRDEDCSVEEIASFLFSMLELFRA